MTTGSVLLYHNGNKRIIESFRRYFRFHNFKGNWTDHCSNFSNHCLYEISIADASDLHLLRARNLGIRILRYITDYEDDQMHRVSELELLDYEQWLSNVVCKNLCFADVIDSQLTVSDVPIGDHGTIITTGRTASKHLEMIDSSANLIECRKTIDQNLLSSRYAILLWRLDQWQCLASTWIHQFNGIPVHQLFGKVVGSATSTSIMPAAWIDNDWKNLCQWVLDSALFFRYILKKPVYHITTEDIIERFQSPSDKVPYDKKDLIPNFDEMQRYYGESLAQKIITTCYNNTRKHII